jgi:hypothetical protein
MDCRRQEYESEMYMEQILREKLTGPSLVTKIPSFYWEPKVHYHIHKSPSCVTILA